MTRPSTVYPKHWSQSKTIGYGAATSIVGALLLALSLHPDVQAWLATIDTEGPVYMIVNGLLVIGLRLVTRTPVTK